MAGNERVEDLIEETGWQKAVVVAVALQTAAQVVARPEELITFGDDDPRAVIVEAEMSFDLQWDLDRRCWIGRRAVGDRQHSDDDRTVCFALDGENDDARPVLFTFF